MLRCLPTDEPLGAAPTWRFTIEEAEPGARRVAFAGLDRLIRFLTSEFARRDDQADEPRP